MVYLSDYPDTFVGYNDDGALDRHPQTPAFDVVFRYDERQLSVPDKKSGRITFELLPYSNGGNIHDLIADALNQVNWQLDDLRVDQVRLKVTFLHGKPRAKTVTFNISPYSCPLKDHVPEHVTIRRCLKKW